MNEFKECPYCKSLTASDFISNDKNFPKAFLCAKCNVSFQFCKKCNKPYKIITDTDSTYLCENCRNKKEN